MNNRTISDSLSLLSKLMELQDENPFKVKSFASAAFTIKQLSFDLSTIDKDKIPTIKGIGSSTGKYIIELIETGELALLNEYIQKTPSGIIEMLSIKGLGPKKIAIIWNELEIESLGELLYACNENKLTLYKGFGEKTQQSIKESIEFYLAASGKLLYAEAVAVVDALKKLLSEAFSEATTHVTGDFRRQMETVEQIDWVTTIPEEALVDFLNKLEFKTTIKDNHTIHSVNEHNLSLCFYCCTEQNIISKLFSSSCSEEFLEQFKDIDTTTYANEEAIFKQAGINYLPPYLRESADIINKNIDNSKIIQPADIKGIIHSHSNWSDGKNTLEEMVVAAIAKEYEYLVISDHSKSAFYANGLKEERIIAQQKQVDELNKKYAPFVVFKSIESDILYDGELDYSKDILSTFDLVIASVHSVLKMNEEKAMSRLIKAIESPYTSILGHPTGRLLLSRKGYPIDHLKIIDACAANKVVLELNAHPRRLDIDWRWIDAALNKGVLISIDPDAHSIEGYDDCKFGVLVTQKAALTPDKNLSSFSLAEMQAFIASQHLKR